MYKHTPKKTITIIGAGPIGLEAALYGSCAGYNIRALEKKDLFHNVRQWGCVTLFSPFELNHSPLGKKILENQGLTLPDNKVLLTGKEYINRYLKPLASSGILKGSIITDCQVLAISRKRILKGDHLGDGQRQNFQFKILAGNADGQEKLYLSDYIIDASGTYGNHNWLGDGGIPALGEMANAHQIEYGLADITGAQKEKYIGKTTLVVGNGHSAANTMIALKRLINEDSHTKVVWITRNNKDLPLTSVPNDVLGGREKVVREANSLVSHSNVRWIKNTVIEKVNYNYESGQFNISIANTEECGSVDAHNIIANVGCKPDNSIYRELQIHECYASGGPMKLSAEILGESSADCLAQNSKGPDVLKNPEPNFYILGMKSYGKNPNFLLKIGYQQIRDVFKLITGDDAFDLYNEAKIVSSGFAKEVVGVKNIASNID